MAGGKFSRACQAPDGNWPRTCNGPRDLRRGTPDVHAELITDIRQQLTPKLRPRYIARVEQYTFLFDPDDPASELYIVPDVRIVQRQGAGHATPARAAEASSVAIAEPIDITGLV